MIFGGCPYCNASTVNYMPDDSPKCYESTCEECGKVYWMLASRIESLAYTQEDFAKEYIVDREKRTIEKRLPFETLPTGDPSP